MDWKATNILFADVKGYSSLNNKQMRVFAEKVLEIAANAIKNLNISHRNTWGDGIVLLSDQISDICEAAILLRNAFQHIHWRRFELPALDIRISIHHGELMIGTDALTGAATFCGRSVVTAARIEPVTPPGRIWMTDEAATMLRRHMQDEGSDYFAIDTIGQIHLPKKYGSIAICNLRRGTEKPLSEDEMRIIREAEELRLASAAIADPDLNVGERGVSLKAAHKILIGVIVASGKVLLVKRRPNTESLSWMFPSGKMWPTAKEEAIIEKEVLEETGVGAEVMGKITEVERHPLTNFRCAYFSMRAESSASPVNGDPKENEEVRWVGIQEALGLIGESLNPVVASHLRAALQRSPQS